MKDSQQNGGAMLFAHKYIKANNERFSTGGAWHGGWF